MNLSIKILGGNVKKPGEAKNTTASLMENTNEKRKVTRHLSKKPITFFKSDSVWNTRLIKK